MAEAEKVAELMGGNIPDVKVAVATAAPVPPGVIEIIEDQVAF